MSTHDMQKQQFARVVKTCVAPFQRAMKERYVLHVRLYDIPHIRQENPRGWNTWAWEDKPS